MKKIVGIIAAVAMATSVFAADISANVSGKMNVWSDQGIKDGKEVKGIGDATGWVGSDTFLNVGANGEKGGASADVRFNGAAKDVVIDSWKVYVAPVDGLKFTYGTAVLPCMLGGYQYGWWKGFGDANLNGLGLNTEINMIDNLAMNLFVGTSVTTDSFKAIPMKFGMKYSMDALNVGVEYSRDSYNAIAAGVEVKAIDNLPIVLAGTYFIPETGKGTVKVDAKIGTNVAGISLTAFNCFMMSLEDGAKVYDVVTGKIGYTINSTAAVNVQVKYAMNTNGKDTNGTSSDYAIAGSDAILYVDVQLPLNFGAASITPEFELTKKGSTTTWAIPVQFKYSF